MTSVRSPIERAESKNPPTTLVQSYNAARKVVVAVIGSTVVGVGIAMLVLPGPALLVIPLGLGILGLEFAWARRWLRKLKEHSAGALQKLRGDPR